MNDYQRGTTQIRANLEQIENSYKPSLSDSVWTYDDSQLKAQLHGILNFEGVTQATVISSEMGTLSSGNPTSRVDLTYRFKLEHRESTRVVELGEVLIKASFAPVIDELRQKALNTMVIEFLKTLAFSLSLVFIFHHLVTRHLQDLADWAEQMNLSSLNAFPKLNRSDQVRDELNSLAEAITQMCETLLEETAKQENSRRAIEDAKNQLSLAIENASIGFCRYIASEKTIIPNGHFCRQLRITEQQLKDLEDSLQELMARMEETTNSEQKERIRQLLQGRIQRVQGNIHFRKFNEQEGVFHITFQSISYKDYRPDELMICCLDKTSEYNAEQLSRELGLSMENRIREGTEHLENELNVQNATLKRVRRELEKADLILNNHYRDSLLSLLANNVRENVSSQSHPTSDQKKPDQTPLEKTARCLELMAETDNQSIDIVKLVQNRIEKLAIPLTNVRTEMPFTLVMNETPGFFDFLFEQLLGPLPGCPSGPAQQLLNISILMKEATLQIQIHQTWLKPLQGDPERVSSLAMCQLLLAAEMTGTLEISHPPQQPDQEWLSIQLPLDSI